MAASGESKKPEKSEQEIFFELMEGIMQGDLAALYKSEVFTVITPPELINQLLSPYLRPYEDMETKSFPAKTQAALGHLFLHLGLTTTNKDNAAALFKQALRFAQAGAEQHHALAQYTPFLAYT